MAAERSAFWWDERLESKSADWSVLSSLVGPDTTTVVDGREAVVVVVAKKKMEKEKGLFEVELYDGGKKKSTSMDKIEDKVGALTLGGGGDDASDSASASGPQQAAEFSKTMGKEKYSKLFNKTSICDVVQKGGSLAEQGDSSENCDTDEVLLTCVVAGWVKTGRVAGGGAFAFIELNDGSTPVNLQIMVTKEAGAASGVEELKQITSTGCSLAIEGDLKRTPKGTKQKFELKCTKIAYVGACDGATYPIAKKKTTFEFLRSQLHLRARTNTISAVARVRNALALATHLFFQQNGFLYVHTPIIGTSDAEGAGEAFMVTTLPAQADALVKGQVSEVERKNREEVPPLPHHVSLTEDPLSLSFSLTVSLRFLVVS